MVGVSIGKEILNSVGPFHMKVCPEIKMLIQREWWPPSSNLKLHSISTFTQKANNEKINNQINIDSTSIETSFIKKNNYTNK